MVRTEAVFPLGCAGALLIKYDNEIKISLQIVGVMDIDLIRIAEGSTNRPYPRS